jgi:hypothetical protein
MIAGCAVDDLDALAGRLTGGAHGETTGLLNVETRSGSARRLGLRSAYGANFEFWERDAPE